MNELQEKIESNLVTKTFHVSGMPESIWRDVDDFCKEYYGDSRWVMIVDLMKLAKDDYRFSLIYREIEDIKVKLANMSQQPQEKEAPKMKIKTFGKGDEE